MFWVDFDEEKKKGPVPPLDPPLRVHSHDGFLSFVIPPPTIFVRDPLMYWVTNKDSRVPTSSLSFL